MAWLAERHGFPGLAAVGKVEAKREIDGKATTASRHYVLSKPLSAARLLDVVRAHWHVENRLYWVLDVVMDEDQARANQDNGSTRGKIKRASWDDVFLLKSRRSLMRLPWMASHGFARLIQHAVKTPPTTYRGIVHGAT